MARPLQAVAEIMATAAPGPFHKKKTLIIDDFPDVRAVIRDIFRKLGVEFIDTASDGNQALEIMAATPYDIVLCDFTLGEGRSGQTVLTEARQRGLLPPAGIWIMLTAEKTAEMVLSAADCAPDDYLVKPVNEQLLVRRLHRLMPRKEAFAEIQAALTAGDSATAIALCDVRLQAGKWQQSLLRLKYQAQRAAGDTDAARETLAQAMQGRRIPWALTELARLDFEAGQLDAAEAHYREAIAESASALDAFDGLAQTLEARQRVQEALDILSQAAALSPGAYARQRALGELAVRAGACDVAERALRQAIRLGQHTYGRSAQPYLTLARMQIDAGQAREALKVLTDCRRDFARTDVLVQVCFWEGLAHIKSGHPADARLPLRDGVRYAGILNGPNVAPFLFNLARMLVEVGEPQTARQAMKLIFFRAPPDAEQAALIRDLLVQTGASDAQAAAWIAGWRSDAAAATPARP